MLSFIHRGKKSPSVHLLFVLLAFVFSGLLQQCVLAAPIKDIEANNTTLTKRFFVPTDQQCDEQLQGKLGPDKSIFYSRPANVGPWAAKLNRIPITKAYGDWVEPSNPNGPQAVTPATMADYTTAIENQVWAQLSRAYARATTGTAYVALNPGQVVDPDSNWLNAELPILRQKGITIMQVNAQDTTAQPVQIWPPPAQGAPPPKA